jgi:hypothetical protein
LLRAVTLNFSEFLQKLEFSIYLNSDKNKNFTKSMNHLLNRQKQISIFNSNEFPTLPIIN